MKLKNNMEIKLIVSLLFAVFIAIFAIQNAGNVEISFLFARFTISQAIVILGSTILGALIAMLLSVLKQIKQNSVIKESNKEINRLTEENRRLQNQIDENYHIQNNIEETEGLGQNKENFSKQEDLFINEEIEIDNE